MHVMAISTVSDEQSFWNAMKKAYGRLPAGARWTVAVASADGTRAVNVIVHKSIDEVRDFVEEWVAAFAVTEYFEADAENAVGLPR